MPTAFPNKLRSTLAALLLYLIHGNIAAQSVFNGSFESGVAIAPSSNIGLFSPDSSSINGWTVSGGTVDYIGTLWLAGEGERSLDMSGISAGTIVQIVNGFAPGQPYRLQFLMAGNPSGGSDLKSLVATIGNSTQTFSFSRTGSTPINLGWDVRNLDFVADSPSLSLSFTSLDSSASGPALDGVRIFSTPEPCVNALVALGMVAFGALRSRSVSVKFAGLWTGGQSCQT